MAFPASKVSGCPAISKKTSASASYGVLPSFVKAPRSPQSERVELMQLNIGHLVKTKYSLYNWNSWHTCGKHMYLMEPHGSSVLCFSSRTRNSGTKEHVRNYGNCSDISSAQAEHVEGGDQITPVRTVNPTQGLAEAYKFAYNDAKIMNERARNDIVLLSRGIMRLDARARQDVAILGSGFLKLDARARKDTEKIDRKMKSKAERLHHIATIIKDTAHSRLKSAADKHWSDGALEADLRRADFHAKRRAVEDTLMALEFVTDIHAMMVNRMYNCPLGRKIVLPMENDMTQRFTLEKNGETLDLFPGEVSIHRISAIEEAYWSMASALSEADGIDYTDPEELELLVRTLIDLDAMDGKSSVSLLAECSSSPDVSTRQALANALAAAPSMWTLGNAGMGALQRLAEDSNPAISAAASKALYELKKQWEIEEGDSWRLMMKQKLDNSEEDNRS